MKYSILLSLPHVFDTGAQQWALLSSLLIFSRTENDLFCFYGDRWTTAAGCCHGPPLSTIACKLLPPASHLADTQYNILSIEVSSKLHFVPPWLCMPLPSSSDISLWVCGHFSNSGIGSFQNNVVSRSFISDTGNWTYKFTFMIGNREQFLKT